MNLINTTEPMKLTAYLMEGIAGPVMVTHDPLQRENGKEIELIFRLVVEAEELTLLNGYEKTPSPECNFNENYIKHVYVPDGDIISVYKDRTISSKDNPYRSPDKPVFKSTPLEYYIRYMSARTFREIYPQTIYDNISHEILDETDDFIRVRVSIRIPKHSHSYLPTVAVYNPLVVLADQNGILSIHKQFELTNEMVEGKTLVTAKARFNCFRPDDELSISAGLDSMFFPFMLMEKTNIMEIVKTETVTIGNDLELKVQTPKYTLKNLKDDLTKYSKYIQDKNKELIPDGYVLLTNTINTSITNAPRELVTHSSESLIKDRAPLTPTHYVEFTNAVEFVFDDSYYTKGDK